MKAVRIMGKGRNIFYNGYPSLGNEDRLPA
jgi:hypothetical protein